MVTHKGHDLRDELTDPEIESVIGDDIVKHIIKFEIDSIKATRDPVFK